MRMRELAERSGASVPTIKFFLREGLLPPVEKSARNVAAYGPVHLDRLRLVGLLHTHGRVSYQAIKGLFDAVQELASWPRERSRAAIIALLDRLHDAAAQDPQEPAIATAPLSLLDRAWLIARGLEEATDPPDRLHAVVAAFRDSALARSLELDLADMEPLIAPVRESLRAETALLERIIRLDRPLADRLILALEALCLWPALHSALSSRLRRPAARRLLT